MHNTIKFSLAIVLICCLNSCSTNDDQELFVNDTQTIDAKQFDLNTDREALIALYNANPDNTLDWDLSDPSVENWTGVQLLRNRVAGLSFLRKNISTIPPEIGNLDQLRTLSFLSNSIIDLPAEIGNLSKLINLDVSFNDLTTIAPEIGNLSGLKYLSLNNNELLEIPEEIGNLTSLRFFRVNRNPLTTIPQKVCDLENTGTRILKDARVTCN